MSSNLLILGGIVITLGMVISYFIGIRAIQASRRSVNYISRQKNKISARWAFSTMGFFLLVGVLSIILVQGLKFNLPAINSPTIETPLPTFEFTQTPNPTDIPESYPTSFAITAPPAVTFTPSALPAPSVPLSIEALFTGNVTPRPD